ncbi:hypothetical protein N8I77_006244 [Diaporthe amygdali]|uniref:NmrA-like domain-containing protein n=1 Tax=Phomopsis amygdali TaxID=1214568 RepID=A0AAD9W3S8_PHOAM|nr:hypothetical protein N8I77_006244 [Diaporthe amygdali]
MAPTKLPLLVVFGATGSQGRSVITALQTSNNAAYRLRGLTSNQSSDAAKELSKSGVEVVEVDIGSEASIYRAVEGAEVVFANTVFPPDIFASHGAAAAEEAESKTALRIARAVAQIKTLKHLVWSTLPDAKKKTAGKLHIPHFQSKVAAVEFIRSQPELIKKTTMLSVGMYGSNLKNPGYVPVYDASIKRYVVKLPLRADVSFSSIGDERKNIGVIVCAILRSGEKTYDKWVVGEAHKTTMNKDVDALDKVVKEQLGIDKRVIFVETSLKDYEVVSGIFVTEKGPMFQYYELQDDAFVDFGQDGKTLYPHELGVTHAELATVEDCLRSFDWQQILQGQRQ